MIKVEDSVFKALEIYIEVINGIDNAVNEGVITASVNLYDNKREPTFTGPLQYILYCTVMYYTVLYCTVLYCTVHRSDVTLGGVK